MDDKEVGHVEFQGAYKRLMPRWELIKGESCNIQRQGGQQEI